MFNGFDQTVPDSIAKLLALIINLVSTLSLLTVGLIFIYNRKFKKHPYPLLGYTCLAEAFVYCTMHTKAFSCVIKIWEVFDLTVSNFDPYFEAATKIPFFGLNAGITIFALNLSVTLNALVYLDLYLTLKNPFYERKARIKWYWLTVTIMLMLQAYLIIIDPEVITLDFDVLHKYHHLRIWN